MSYQKVTGTLNPGGHPGSYNGQDAYNDMLVISNGSNISRQRSVTQYRYADSNKPSGLYARSANCPTRGGDSLSEPTMMSDRKGHNGITENGISTTLNAQEKERPMIAEKGGDAMTSVVRRLTPLE